MWNVTHSERLAYSRAQAIRLHMVHGETRIVVKDGRQYYEAWGGDEEVELDENG